MPTISLVMIVKNEEAILERAIKSVLPIIDECVICDTGSTDGTKDIIKKFGPIHEIPFTNFVDTKNAALKKATCDYILMLDADEYLTSGLQKLKAYADKADFDGVDGCIEEYAAGSIVCSYRRTRMWRNDGSWLFSGPGVHEVIGSAKQHIATTYDPDIKIVHDHSHRTEEDQSKIRERFQWYVSLLKDAIAKNPHDHRAWFYLGRTYRDLNLPLLAIDAYRRYLALPDNHFRDEQWQALYDIALCNKGQGEYTKAIDNCDRAITLDPRRAEAHTLKGHIYYALQDWPNAAAAYEAAMNCTIPEDVVLFVNHRDYFENPADNLAICYHKMHRHDAAEAVTVELTKRLPRIDDRLNNNLSFYREKTKSVIFLTLGLTPEPVYGGILEKQGVHGVETTYIELADELNDLGHTVFLFCNCENEHKYQGVYYVPYEKLPEKLSLNPGYTITSRWFDSLYFEQTSKKIVWFQDAYFSEPNRPDVFQTADMIVCSSPWHRNYIAERYGHKIDAGKINIIPLGIRKALFMDRVQKDPMKMIYSSNPDRGLYILLDIWGELSAMFPALYLDIYYGWEGLKTWSPTAKWQQNVDAQQYGALQTAAKFNNIHFKGRLTKQQLAREMMGATLCLYPNNFYETFCLTALETQMAGVPMITSNMGAMATTLLNHDCNVLLDGDPFSDRYKQNFLNAAVNLLKDRPLLARYAVECADYAMHLGCGWEHIAAMWQRQLWDL